MSSTVVVEKVDVNKTIEVGKIMGINIEASTENLEKVVRCLREFDGHP